MNWIRKRKKKERRAKKKKEIRALQFKLPIVPRITNKRMTRCQFEEKLSGIKSHEDGGFRAQDDSFTDKETGIFYNRQHRLRSAVITNRQMDTYIKHKFGQKLKCLRIHTKEPKEYVAATWNDLYWELDGKA